MNKFKAFLAIILISIFSFSGLLVDNCSAKDEEYMKILIVSPGNKHEIYEGEKIKLDKIIKNNKEDNIDKELLWESLDSKIATVNQDGLVVGVKEGNTKIKLSMKNNKDNFTYFDLKVKYKKHEDKSNTIKEALDNVKGFYNENIKLDHLVALSFRATNKELDSNNARDIMIHPDRSIFTADDIISKANTVYCAQNIMSIIAIGKDPYEYEYKGKIINFVDMLLKSQKSNGQFVILKGLDDNNIKSLAYAIMALDMVGEKYNVESAVKALINLNKEKRYNNVAFGEIGYKALSITALSKHKDVPGVKEFIDTCINEFKKAQNDEGGFNGAKSKMNSSCTTAMVIQALIANDINPLLWNNAGKTMLDSILDHQKENGSFKDANGEDNHDYKATDQCCAALSDLHMGKSMYKVVKFIRKKDFNIELLGENKFKNGQDVNIKVKVKSNVSKDKKCTLIVQIYDKDLNKMIKYAYINKNIEGRTTEFLNAGLDIPSKGNYMVKVLLWDDVDNINPLSDVFKIDVCN